MKNPDCGILPALFVPHGAPTFAIAPGAAGAAMASWARQSVRPGAVLVISAHWDTATPALSTVPSPETLHDYAGFPQELYAIRYPAKGTVATAMECRALLEEAGFDVVLDVRRGLDHGAWIPLRLMYPAADIPVVALSVQGRLGPLHHYRLGQALAPLRAAGVLIVGSGNLTHNLRDFARLAPDDAAPDYVASFTDWLQQRLQAGDVSALLNYRDRAPGAIEAHPTEEHLLPLFVVLGAAGPGFAARQIHRGVAHSMLAMDAYAFQSGDDFLSQTH